MSDYAKLYARLCGAIDEVLDELGTIPEARHARERLQAAIGRGSAVSGHRRREKARGRRLSASLAGTVIFVTVSIPPPAVRLLRSARGRRLS